MKYIKIKFSFLDELSNEKRLGCEVEANVSESGDLLEIEFARIAASSKACSIVGHDKVRILQCELV